MGNVGKNSSYKYITNQDAVAYALGRRGNKIEEIVIHHWGAMGQTFDSVMNWFCHNNSCETSAHYVAEAGKVACIVSPYDTAYHAGEWQHNLRSIGIECRPEAMEEDYETVGQLVADIWRDWGKLPLIRHKDIVPTSCPGVWDIGRIKAIAEKYYYADSVEDKNIPAKWAEDAWEFAKSKGLMDGTRPKDALTRQEFAVILKRIMNK